MKLKRLDGEKDMDRDTNVISFSHDGEKYTITPEVVGFRIHKHSLDDGLRIEPSCHNEIIVK